MAGAGRGPERRSLAPVPRSHEPMLQLLGAAFGFGGAALGMAVPRAGRALVVAPVRRQPAWVSESQWSNWQACYEGRSQER